jgi:5-methylcytosine-specific restriction enzyme subunit McrC
MIPIKNIYHMLSYAFQTLQSQGYKKLETEEFSSAADLLAAILIRGVELQLKQGLGRSYIEETESLKALRGRIRMTESMKAMSLQRGQMICTYEVFSEDSILNRIIKSTLLLLLRAQITKERKNKIKKLLVYFSEIREIDLYSVNWQIQFNRNNQGYRMMIGICQLVVKGLLQTQKDGSIRLMDFLDEQRMCRLYEKFILEYYRKEHSELKASASQIDWATDDEYQEMLPILQTDITLEKEDGILIIDAKYYENILQSRYESQSVRSANLYQIFTYVKNRQAKEVNRKVAGMLLYAATDEGLQPDYKYSLSKSRITVRTLNLNCDFPEIRKQLDQIADEMSYWRS